MNHSELVFEEEEYGYRRCMVSVLRVWYLRGVVCVGFGTPWSDGVYEWVLLVFACVIFTNGNCLSSAWMLLHE